VVERASINPGYGHNKKNKLIHIMYYSGGGVTATIIHSPGQIYTHTHTHMFIRSFPAIETGVIMAVKILRLVIVSALIESVLTAQIQARFVKCYDKDATSTPLYYREVMTEARSACTLVCLKDDTCAGIDVCPVGDEDRQDYLCKLRNSSHMETCEAQNKCELEPFCESFRRGSMQIYYFERKKSKTKPSQHPNKRSKDGNNKYSDRQLQFF
jgi:hypothetical protein